MAAYDVISLFSGGMGLDLGVEGAGRLMGGLLGSPAARFRIKACIEVDSACQETIQTNASGGRLGINEGSILGDITRIDEPKRVMSAVGQEREVDIIIGGPPCQTFSTAGKRATVQDRRGLLLWHFLRFVQELRPKAFLIENVRGLISAAISHRPIRQRGPGNLPLRPEEQPGSVLHALLDDFALLGYRVDVFEVNAVNYGAPQLRERVFLIGNRYNVQTKFSLPTHGNPLTRQTGIDVPRLLPWRNLKDTLWDLEEVEREVMDFSPRKKKYLSLVPPGGNWRSLPPDVRKESMGAAWFAKGGRSGWWRRLSWDLPSPCLVTMPNHASTSLCHPEEIRALSLGEYKRIQEFPDDWIVCGRLAEKYSQVGNAVPIRLAEVAAFALADVMKEIESGLHPVAPGDRVVPGRRVYIHSHVRTRKWYYNGEAVVWNGDRSASIGQKVTVNRRELDA